MGQPTGSGTAEPLIDLGELTAEAQSDRDEGPLRAPRRLALALVAVLVAAGLFGDAARVPLRPVLTTSFTPTDFDMRGDVLYVFDGGYAPNRVVAHRLRDGQRLWQVGSPTTSAYQTLEQVGSRTLFIPDQCTASGSVSTVAVDTTSGREAWRRPGMAERRVNGTALVLMARPRPTFGCGTGSAPTRVYWDAVDAATGTVTWSIEVPEFARISFDFDNDRGARWVAFVARDGTVTIRDLLTGAVTGQIVLPELAQPVDPGAAVPPDLMIVGSQVLLVRRPAIRAGGEPAMLDITAYDLLTFAHRWNVRVDVGPSDLKGGAGYVDLAACGPMLCLRGPQRTLFLDPRDGTQRWRSSLWLLAVTGGWALLADPQASGEQTPPGGLTVRDVRTGQLRGAIPGWRVITADVRRTAAPVLGVSVGDRTWFGRLDLARMRVVAVGSAPGRYGSCLAEPEYFACRGIDGSVRVWRSRGG
ncbi:MAG TPA: PQQ-binding-like beta-propeller repeat protein [Planosporangium sp.]|jgi:outer membrane protein assembly factor BamB|nr:PQQ-binding-like beta-propeller repeat protein [Planosporangium sp.]